MPELVKNDISFISLAHLVPEISYFQNFKISSAAILDLEVKMVQKRYDKYFIGFFMPELVKNDISFISVAHLVQEI